MTKIKKRKRKNGLLLIYIILAAIIFMVAGYALLNQTISITGTATADADFNLIWENPVISNSQGSTTLAPVLSESDTILTVNPELGMPTDYVEITVNVRNNGQIAAEVTDIVITEVLGTDMVVTYTPEFVMSETIAAGASREVVILVEYDDASENEEPISETFGLVIEYTQE